MKEPCIISTNQTNQNIKGVDGESPREPRTIREPDAVGCERWQVTNTEFTPEGWKYRGLEPKYATSPTGERTMLTGDML